MAALTSGRQRERVSLEALNIEKPERHTAQNQQAPQNPQNQHDEVQNAVPANFFTADAPSVPRTAEVSAPRPGSPTKATFPVKLPSRFRG